MIDAYFKKEIPFSFHDRRLTFRVSQALFSSHEIDAGSRFLLRTLPQPLPAGLRVLDVGCGYGTLGLALAAQDATAQVQLVDRDALAVAYAGQNAALNGLENATVSGSLGYDDVSKRPFDLILSNIPGKAGERVITQLLLDARHYLHPDGRVAVVVVRPLAEQVTALLQETADIDILFTEQTANHAVFHYRFTALPTAPPQTALARGVYARDEMTVSYKKLHFPMQTVFGVPEFDTVSYQNRLLFNLLSELPPASVNHPLLLNPGQGHAAVAAWRLLQPAQITLIDRDLLALRTTMRNLAANGCASEVVSLHHAIEAPPLPAPVDVAAALLRDAEGPQLAAAWIREIGAQMEANGRFLLAANSHLISQLLILLKKERAFKLQSRKKRKGFSAVILRRTGPPV